MHNYSSSIMMLNICSAPTAHHQVQHTDCSRMIDDEWTTELPPVSVLIIVVFFFFKPKPSSWKTELKNRTEPILFWHFFRPQKDFFRPQKSFFFDPKKNFFFDPKKFFFWGRKKFWAQKKKKKLKNIYCLSLTIHTVK